MSIDQNSSNVNRVYIICPLLEILESEAKFIKILLKNVIVALVAGLTLSNLLILTTSLISNLSASDIRFEKTSMS